MPNRSFYFEKRVTKTSYSDDPSSGEIDVARLVAGDPAFLVEDRTSKRQSKALVLANLEYDKWPSIKKMIFQVRLNQLRQEGFEIYLNSGMRIDDILSSVIFNTPVSHDAQRSKEALSTLLDRPMDELFFFDFDSTEAFILGDEEDYQALLGEADVTLTTPISMDNLNKLLTENQSILTSLNISAPLDLQGDLDSELLFPKLEMISLDQEGLNTDILVEIIKKSKRLSKLSFTRVSSFFSVILPSLQHPEEMTALALSYLSFTREELEKVFEQFPNLKQLRLEDCYFPFRVLPFNPDFSSFVEIDLIKQSIQIESLGSLLQSAPNLKKLCINADNNLVDGLPENFDLPVLEELELESSELTGEKFSRLLQSAPQLRVLKFHPGEVWSPHALSETFNDSPDASYAKDTSGLQGAFPERLNLSSLEELELESRNLTSESLDRILQSAPHLKSLTLMPGENLPKHFELPKLAVLKLECPSPKTDQLSLVFNNLPPLKVLELTSSYDSVDGDFLANVDFSLLEEIHLNNINITKEDFVRLLQSAPNLKRLYLTQANGLQDCFADHLNLPLLEELEIGHTDLSHDMVGLILSSTPKLKQVKFEACLDVEHVLSQALPRSLNLSSPEEIKALGKLLRDDGVDLKNRSEDWIKASLAPIFDRFSREEQLLNLRGKSTTHQTQQYKSDLSELVKGSASSTPTSMDADTEWKKTTFNLKRQFIGKPDVPSLSDIRLHVYSGFELNPASRGLKSPFILLPIEPNEDNFESVSAKVSTSLYQQYESKGAGYYFFRDTLSLNDRWQALPSLFSDEELERYSLSPLNEVEIKRDKVSGRHYIRLKGEGVSKSAVVQFEMLLSHRPKYEYTVSDLPTEIQAIVKDCYSFGNKRLEISPDATSKACLDALMEQKTGACRHRSLVFQQKMKDADLSERYPVRLVSNACHMYAEVQFEGTWVKCDLGGYESELEIDNSAISEEPKLTSHEIFDERCISTPEELVSERYFSHSKPYLNTRQHLLKLVQGGHRQNTLLNTTEIEGVRLALEKEARRLGRRCFYIHSPEELRIADAYMKREGSRGSIVNSKGGPLYDFISEDSPLFIVNFNGFKSDDIVRCNSILDDEPMLDGVSIPRSYRLIGLYDRSRPDAYTGADFTSRFDVQEEIEGISGVPGLSVSSEAFSSNEVVIECSGELGWEKTATGYWSLKENAWHFFEGSFLKGLREGQSHFVFNNAPVNHPDFQRFIHDLSLHGGVYHRGQLFAELPEGFTIRFTAHAPEFRRVFRHHPDASLATPCYVLNSNHFSQFMTQASHAEEDLVFEQGLIEQYAGQELRIYLTSTLPSDVWLSLYQCCEQHNVTLSVICAPGVSVPLGMLSGEAKGSCQCPMASHTLLKTEVPEGLDSDRVEIDITEVSASELLTHLKAGLDKETGHLYCKEIEGYLEKALSEGKTVVLKGEWSETLSLSLHDFLFRRMQDKSARGQLILVSESPAHFPLLSSQATLVSSVKPKPSAISRDAVYESRFSVVDSVLSTEPSVLLTGATGVGKTHFIETEWRSAYPACHYGEESVLDWIRDEREGMKTLFIDEANITDKQWTMFEGLYDTPASIFYQGAYYPLSDSHKVIFAGNPLSYGGERELPLFFKRHSVEVQFHPLPVEVIQSTLGLDEETVAPILKMVDEVMHLDKRDTLITPREILMIAYLTKTFLSNHPEESNKALVASHFAYEIVKQHVPKQFFNSFEQKFKPKSGLPSPSIVLPDFSVNPRNQVAIHALHMHLELRKQRLLGHSGIPSRGGLGGIVLEGSPGIGKSAMVKQLFTAKGLKENQDYVCLPVTLSLKQKAACLKDAFHEGKIVMIDEINSSPMLERLLNALLEGHDLEGNPAKKPGFMIVGTQNPTTFSGRVKTTLPLKHRLQTVVLEDYTHQDMLDILKHMDIPEKIASEMLKEASKIPSCCFRDIQKVAKKWKDNPVHQKDVQPDEVPAPEKQHPTHLAKQKLMEMKELQDSHIERLPSRSMRGG